ncbi:TetR/AcrR family transcriptional regulator [Granulicella cerasi]|uniref:TetR/AcrR family transcriptional regulator n=1 Tax=Granulicella cerasi TaxID=741063 RepID=A0ABW1ZCF8_9BACT|nr:TetR/AcrR family transcriptional regulator [Granulicella cerasi]
MKNATKESSKTAMVAEKDRLIVLSAREHFLRDGFSGASMDAIARSAGVSVKTIYSHFANKNELFSHVMVAACTDHLLSEPLPPEEALAKQFAWFANATQPGLARAGVEYLQHLLSEEQVALYRVVTRDADQFPELGQHYQKNIARGRTGILIAYLKSVARKRSWLKRDAAQDAALYEALLRGAFYEQVLHGLVKVNPDAIEAQARSAASRMWRVLTTEQKESHRSTRIQGATR